MLIEMTRQGPQVIPTFHSSPNDLTFREAAEANSKLNDDRGPKVIRHTVYLGDVLKLIDQNLEGNRAGDVSNSSAAQIIYERIEMVLLMFRNDVRNL